MPLLPNPLTIASPSSAAVTPAAMSSTVTALPPSSVMPGEPAPPPTWPSTVTFVAITKVEARSIVCPAMSGAKTMVSPAVAAASSARRLPAPASAAVETTRVPGAPT
ncbi:MAG TPA: hypothetical protein VIJ55_16000 [Acetobacteraceae bacterium]